jgi:hypothetical protein
MLRSVRLRRDIPSASNPPVRCGRASGPQAEQRLKGGHRLPTSIVAKDEFIQVDLKLRLTDPVVRADQPLLQIADRAVRERHHRSRAFAQGAPERLGTAHVLDARGLQVLEAFQAVGVDRRSRLTCCLTKSIIVVCLKFGITAILMRPETPPRFSTATITIAALRPLS